MRFYVMLYYGMLARHCRWCADQDPARQGEYLQLAEEIDGELLRTAERLEAEYPYQVIPIRKLVSAQLASGLTLCRTCKALSGTTARNAQRLAGIKTS